MAIDTTYLTASGIVEELLVIFADSGCPRLRSSDAVLLNAAGDNMHLFDISYVTRSGRWTDEFIVSLRPDANLEPWRSVVASRLAAMRDHRKVFFPEYAAA